MPSDPPFSGWARISNIKPADPLNLGKKQGICGKYAKILEVMLLSAEYVGLKPSPVVHMHWFPGKKDASAHYTREEKGCVDTFRLRERGDYSGTSLIRTSEIRTPRFNGRFAQERISLPLSQSLFNPGNADTPLFRKADEYFYEQKHIMSMVYSVESQPYRNARKSRVLIARLPPTHCALPFPHHSSGYRLATITS